MTRRALILLAGTLLLTGRAHGNSEPAPAGASPWSPAIEETLQAAGTNATALVTALRKTQSAEREAMEFLLEHMPAPDAQCLSADYLVENVRLACAAMKAAPWQAQVPKETFLNDVLPYACLNETRESWRQQLHDICAPLVADCRTPGEAAQRLNRELFPLLKVRYSTERKRPDQSPSETMASGKATCTGLAILLVDACRSVGVPARVAGTPRWTNTRGNHTWVEVWDGDWHFTGAAEPDPNGLDRAWFVHNASQAERDTPQHAIYATSFRQTGVHFPLAWAPRVTWVNAVNVTDRYTPKEARLAQEKRRLLVKVLDTPEGERIAAAVAVSDSGAPAHVLRGTSKDESADLNDILAFEVAQGGRYVIEVTKGDRVVRREVSTGTNQQEVITIPLTETVAPAPTPQACYAPPPVLFPLAPGQADSLKQALAEYFSAPAEQRAQWKFSASQETLLRENDPAVRRSAWEAYRSAPIHDAMKQDFEAGQVRFQKHLSPYKVKTVGARPTNGWALFIAMHGGGGAPKAVNDSQWEHMQVYYKDHPEAGGYLYVALRAPNDTWNGFYDVYVYPLIANLIRQFLLFGDVDANKVFIMGYSHGGYGAFAIGPKIPDRFAAIHASAAAPTDGETTAKTLRNTVFTCMVGEKDTRYGRFDRNRNFAAEIEKLRGDRHDIYPVRVDIKEGFGHSGLPDRDKITEMYAAARNPVPRDLSWLMTDQVITDFFWLRAENPSKQQEILASCTDNRFVVTANSNVAAFTVLFDSRLVDFAKPVQVELNGAATSHTFAPSLKTLAESLLRRGDPDLAFTASFAVRRDDQSGRLALSQAVAGDAPSVAKPTPQQLAWQRHEFIAFAHFGMNTFTDREWGEGKEDPRLFNPTDLDARQWAAVLQEAGVKLLILTAKHHDGFCLWPSKFTGHSVRNSPWRDGQGDVVREVVDALRERQIRVGLYLSPWDRNQPTYGDSPKYNEYFRNQLRELLTNYGAVDEVWFDGACGEGPNGKKQEYDWPSYYALIRELQPKALIAISGPDIRWVGNESGVARENESSVVQRDGQPAWHPAECDVSIRPGWFYHPAEDTHVKSLATLADIYFKSVGRNSVLLLNIPPDRRGRIAEADVARLREFGAFVRQLYAVDFVTDAAVTASSRRDPSGHERHLKDGKLETCWTPADTQITGSIEFDLGKPQTFNVARIQEDISAGERVQAYRVEALDGDKWRTLTAGQVIGHKQLRRFPTVTAQRVRLVIDKASAAPALSEFGLHFNPLAPGGSGALTAHRPATASDVHPGGTQFGPDKAVDDDPETRWATSDHIQQAWLEVELAQPSTISRLVIKELDPRLTQYQLQYRLTQDEDWKVAYEGAQAGTHFDANFPPVQARSVRLNILNSTRPPTIWEFQVFAKPSEAAQSRPGQ